MNKNFAVVSNIVLSPDFEIDLKTQMEKLGVDAEVQRIEAAEIENDSVKLRGADFILVLMNLDSFWAEHPDVRMPYQEITDNLMRSTFDYFAKLYHRIRKISEKYIIWYGFEGYADRTMGIFGNRLSESQFMIEELNHKLCDEMEAADIYIDMQKLIAAVGIERAYDWKGRYRWNKPYSDEVVKRVIGEACKQYQIIHRMGPKCMILDCDNVLWGGVLSEDGIEGICVGRSGTGRPFYDFQRYLKLLKTKGVILAICSKNDVEDLHKVFCLHPEMTLKEDDFDYIAANWNNKPDNIRNIIEELSISEKQAVFVDDSKFEIEAVRSILPKIKAVQFNYSTIYEELSCFHVQLGIDAESGERRHETYRSDAERRKLRGRFDDYETYLNELNSRVEIHEALPVEYMRISELTLRANKFTNGTRYNFLELKSRLKKDGYQLFSISLSDRYSDLGIVGAVGIEEEQLDLFCLSCRAAGRKVEEEMCGYVMKAGVKEYKFACTGKNMEIEKLLKMRGLCKIQRKETGEADV